jgi:glycosyltransferase involved in cell wall biosynthesis
VWDDRVTVVIPTKDRPHLLALSVGSVLRQVGVDLRVLVVDDGSAVPAGAGLPSDPRLQVLRHAGPRGVSSARNAGIAAVETRWTAFLDDDDLWSPDKLRRQLEAVRRTSYRWACSSSASFSGTTVLDVMDPPDTDDVSQVLLRGNVVSGSASGVLAETALVRAVGGFDEALPSMEDWDLWIRLAQESPLARVPAVDVGQRVHRTSRGHDLALQPAALRMIQAKCAAAAPPLVVAPDASFYEYWARMEYDAGRWRSGVRRTVDLAVRQRHPIALRTPVRRLLPGPLQRRVRASLLSARARRSPEQDWSWLQPYLLDA